MGNWRGGAETAPRSEHCLGVLLADITMALSNPPDLGNGGTGYEGLDRHSYGNSVCGRNMNGLVW